MSTLALIILNHGSINCDVEDGHQHASIEPWALLSRNDRESTSTFPLRWHTSFESIPPSSADA
jgi:hypothetical protein